jgi:hypothetical protein
MEYNDEYIAKKRGRAKMGGGQQIGAMRPFIPVNIASGLSKSLAKRIITKRCLWLICISQSDIAKMHVADLTSKYSPEAQNLDVM